MLTFCFCLTHVCHVNDLGIIIYHQHRRSPHIYNYCLLVLVCSKFNFFYYYYEHIYTHKQFLTKSKLIQKKSSWNWAVKLCVGVCEKLNWQRVSERERERELLEVILLYISYINDGQYCLMFLFFYTISELLLNCWIELVEHLQFSLSILFFKNNNNFKISFFHSREPLTYL